MNKEYKNLVLGCQNCKKDFTIESDDFSFYEKIKVPPPTFCPECRLIRRLIMRNERVLYKRKCDLCNLDKVFVYESGSPFKVYCRDCFNSDNWDSLIYAQDYDFLKSFFDQFITLYNSTPRVGVIKQGFDINSEYTNRVTDLKNCYLIFASAYNQDCMYGWSIWYSNNSIDCLNVIKCEKCYWCTDCYNCNNLKFSKECHECIDSYFLLNCRNCQNCFGCTNLRNKNYCIFNEQYTKEEYFKKLKEFNLSNKNNLKEIQEKVKNIFENAITPHFVGVKNMNVSGNWINNSKNTKNSFGCDKVEDSKNLFIVNEAKEVMDLTYWGKGSELVYETASAGIGCFNVMFCNESWNQLNNIQYCHNCLNSSNLFGCVGLRNKQYCILNKQYTREEYEILIPKIINHMNVMTFIDNVGRIIKYGEFFPSDMVPFAYNETVAQEYFPKTKEEALKSGFKWKEIEDKVYNPTIMGNFLPVDIKVIDDNILNEVIGCVHEQKCGHQCTKAFKITSDELQFYKTNEISLPELCPNCRHYQRLSQRNPLKLWHRSCMKEGCNNEFETSYAPERPEIVYCEKCYQNEVY